MSIRLTKSVKFAEVEQSFAQKIKTLAEGNLKIKFTPLDIYSDNDQTKSLTLRLTISPTDRTLSGDEIHEIMAEFEQIVKNNNAEVI